MLFALPEASIFSFTTDRTGSGKRFSFTVPGNGYGGFSLFPLIGDPADLVSIQFFIQANTDDAGTGITYRYHMLVGADFAQFLLRLISP